MFAKITRYSNVSAKALKEILATYADAGKSTDPALVAKVKKIHNEQLAKWQAEGWKADEKGNYSFANQIPQVFTKEHPKGRAPVTEGVQRQELYEMIDSTCDEYGEAKVAKWIDNGFSLGLRRAMKRKPSDGVAAAAAYSEAQDAFMVEVMAAPTGPAAEGFKACKDSEARKAYILEWYGVEDNDNEG